MRILKLLKLAPLVLGLNCAFGTIRPITKATDENTRQVRTVWHQPGLSWHNSPWFRPEDLTTPMRVVIAIDTQACIMDERDVNEPLPLAFYSCPGQWRIARAVR